MRLNLCRSIQCSLLVAFFCAGCIEVPPPRVLSPWPPPEFRVAPGADGRITGQRLQALQDPTALAASYTDSLAFSRRQFILATGHAAHRMGVYDLETGRPIRVADDPSGVSELRFLPDEQRLLATCGSYEASLLKMWNLDGLTSSVVPIPIKFLDRTALSPDGCTLAVGREPEVAVWDLATARKLWDVKPAIDWHSVLDLDFSHDGRWLAVAGRQVTLLDVRSRQSVGVLRLEDPSTIGRLAFFSGGKRLAALSVHGLVVWSVPDGKRLLWRPFPGSSNCCLAISPDETLLAYGANDGDVQFVDPDRNAPLASISQVDGKLTALAFGHQRNILATAFVNQGIRFADQCRLQLWKVQRLDRTDGPGAKNRQK